MRPSDMRLRGGGLRNSGAQNSAKLAEISASVAAGEGCCESEKGKSMACWRGRSKGVRLASSARSKGAGRRSSND